MCMSPLGHPMSRKSDRNLSIDGISMIRRSTFRGRAQDLYRHDTAYIPIIYAFRRTVNQKGSAIYHKFLLWFVCLSNRFHTIWDFRPQYLPV